MSWSCCLRSDLAPPRPYPALEQLGDVGRRASSWRNLCTKPASEKTAASNSPKAQHMSRLLVFMHHDVRLGSRGRTASHQAVGLPGSGQRFRTSFSKCLPCRAKFSTAQGRVCPAWVKLHLLLYSFADGAWGLCFQLQLEKRQQALWNISCFFS